MNGLQTETTQITHPPPSSRDFKRLGLNRLDLSINIPVNAMLQFCVDIVARFDDISGAKAPVTVMCHVINIFPSLLQWHMVVTWQHTEHCFRSWSQCHHSALCWMRSVQHIAHNDTLTVYTSNHEPSAYNKHRLLVQI